MIEDITPRNMQAPAIPMLTDVVSRGAKAPPLHETDEDPEESDKSGELAFEPGSELGPEQLADYDSENPTVLPEADTDQADEEEETSPAKPFSLDELSEIPIPVSENETINEIIEQAMPLLMGELEKVARKTLKEILEAQASDQEDQPSD